MNKDKPRSGKPIKPKLLERDIQQTCTEFLELDGWRAFRTELTIQRERGRVVGERGQPDYLYLRYTDDGMARVLWIEYKKPGEKPRPDQLAWHEAERKRGGIVLVVDDIDWFMRWYRLGGLARNVRVFRVCPTSDDGTA